MNSRKLYMAGGACLSLMGLTWYLSVALTGDVVNAEALVKIVAQCIDAVTTVVLGYLGANVLDKAKGVIEALKTKKEDES